MLEFTSQEFPTVEQTITNNATLLYKQKKHFLANIRTLIGTLSITMVGLLYLKDFSLLLFCPKVLLNFFLSNPFMTNVPGVVFEDKTKHSYSVFLLGWVLFINGGSFIYHLNTRPASGASPDEWLHGYFSLQFIGESPVAFAGELLLYDVFLFILQIVYFCLMCATDDLNVLLSLSYEVNESSDGVVRLDILSDGYNGDVSLLTLDIWDKVQTVWRLLREDAAHAEVPEDIARHRTMSFLIV